MEAKYTKPFSKKQIKTLDIILLRNGSYYIALRNIDCMDKLENETDMYGISLDNYDDKLMHRSEPDLDIVQVFRPITYLQILKRLKSYNTIDDFINSNSNSVNVMYYR